MMRPGPRVCARVAAAGIVAAAIAGCTLGTAGTRPGGMGGAAGSNGPHGGGQQGGGGHGGGGGGAPDLPASCKDVLDADADAGDGLYVIDPDGAGPIPPFRARCLMSIEGGGFTRFNWVTGVFPDGADPLGEELASCDPGASVCRGRIPTSAAPSDLLVLEPGSGEHARWVFDETSLSNAVLAALRNKTEACIVNNPEPFMPVMSTSTEVFCGNNASSGCDSFLYGMGECHGGSAWVMHFDDDGWYCRAAFKMGRTLASPGNTPCSSADLGYMDACDCTAEGGELYYR